MKNDAERMERALWEVLREHASDDEEGFCIALGVISAVRTKMFAEADRHAPGLAERLRVGIAEREPALLAMLAERHAAARGFDA